MQKHTKRILRVLGQTGHITNIHQDRMRRALLPGKRISVTGKIYWESRRNRSDSRGSRT